MDVQRFVDMEERLDHVDSVALLDAPSKHSKHNAVAALPPGDGKQSHNALMLIAELCGHVQLMAKLLVKLRSTCMLSHVFVGGIFGKLVPMVTVVNWSYIVSEYLSVQRMEIAGVARSRGQSFHSTGSWQ